MHGLVHTPGDCFAVLRHGEAFDLLHATRIALHAFVQETLLLSAFAVLHQVQTTVCVAVHLAA